MVVDLTRLKNNFVEYIDIDTTYSFSLEQLEKTNIIKLDNVIIKGKIIKKHEIYELQLDISGEFILPCSLSLKPTNVSFNCHIDDDLEQLLQEIGLNLTNSIDILPIIWENILMEIPLKVVSESTDFITSGEGWSLIEDNEM